jgi:hypothetical protein
MTELGNVFHQSRLCITGTYIGGGGRGFEQMISKTATPFSPQGRK